MHPPFLNAGNAGPFTLDGTRTYRVGDRRVALIDPGPDVEHHVRAVVSWLGDADEVAVLLTHGHADHAAAARSVADALGGVVYGPEGVAGVDLPLADGDAVPTDLGRLHALHTPGHSSDHLCFLWPERDALFAGDLLLGVGDTTWVGEYRGCVADYLSSLQRVGALAPAVVYPAHGPPITDVAGVVDRYRSHRHARIAQVDAALQAHPGASVDELLGIVYGASLPDGVRAAARASLQALVDHVRGAAPR